VAEKKSGVSAQKMASSESGSVEHGARDWLENARVVVPPGELAQNGGQNKNRVVRAFLVP
jgi:FAD/FMN-containing dehydrogenase